MLREAFREARPRHLCARPSPRGRGQKGSESQERPPQAHVPTVPLEQAGALGERAPRFLRLHRDQTQHSPRQPRPHGLSPLPESAGSLAARREQKSVPAHTRVPPGPRRTHRVPRWASRPTQRIAILSEWRCVGWDLLGCSHTPATHTHTPCTHHGNMCPSTRLHVSSHLHAHRHMGLRSARGEYTSVYTSPCTCAHAHTPISELTHTMHTRAHPPGHTQPDH